MRLVNVLGKVLVVAGVAGGMLGGAAALGSTLFEAPPRDAAEFAERVEAGSTHWDDLETTEAKGTKAASDKRRRTPAERRYARKLNAMCLRHEREANAVPRPQSEAELRAWFEALVPLFERQENEYRALTPPATYKTEAARLLTLSDSGLRVVEQVAAALRRGETKAVAPMLAKLDALGRRSDAIFRRIGARACLSDDIALS